MKKFVCTLALFSALFSSSAFAKEWAICTEKAVDFEMSSDVFKSIKLSLKTKKDVRYNELCYLFSLDNQEDQDAIKRVEEIYQTQNKAELQTLYIYVAASKMVPE